MSDLDDLIVFTLAQLALDEAAAKAAQKAAAAPWLAANSLLLVQDADGVYGIDVAEVTNYRYDPVLVHAARQDPARVLREVEAKRSIIKAHGRAEHYCPLPVLPSRHGQLWTPEEGPCWTLRLLAAVYSDHPDFRPEWKP